MVVYKITKDDCYFDCRDDDHILYIDASNWKEGKPIRIGKIEIPYPGIKHNPRYNCTFLRKGEVINMSRFLVKFVPIYIEYPSQENEIIYIDADFYKNIYDFMNSVRMKKVEFPEYGLVFFKSDKTDTLFYNNLIFVFDKKSGVQHMAFNKYVLITLHVGKVPLFINGGFRYIRLKMRYEIVRGECGPLFYGNLNICFGKPE